MIAIHDVTDHIRRHGKIIPTLNEANFIFDRRRMGLIAETEELTEALFDVLAGYRMPEHGYVFRSGKVSWPLGRQIQLRSELTGRTTLRFVAQLYSLDFDECEHIVRDLIDFRQFYDKNVTEWPRILGVLFNHAVALLPDFDIYLVEGNPVVGDDDFMARWMPLFEERIRDRQMIMSCRYPFHLKNFCRSVAVLKAGRLCFQPDVESAFEFLESDA